MITRLRLARASGIATICLSFAAVWLEFPPLTLLLSAAVQVVVLFALRARRGRFPAAVCFGITACERLLWSAFSFSQGNPSWLLLLSGLCSVLGAAALLWPTLAAKSEQAPLPRLPGTWALVSTLVVVAVDTCILAVSPAPAQGPIAVLVMGLSALLLFCGFMLASHAGRLRWPLQLASVAASGLATFNLSGRFTGEQAPATPLELAAFAGPAFAFALGFDWIRSSTTSHGRLARAVATVYAGGLAPLLLAGPHQLSPRSLVLLLAHALAFGVAAALAPRVAGVRRESLQRWTPATGFPRGLGGSLAVIIVMPCIALAVATQANMSPVVPGLAVGCTLVVSIFRARMFRASIWLLATAPMLLLGFIHDPRPNAETCFYAFVGLVVATWIAWVVSSPQLNVHFFRRWARAPSPSPRASFALGAIGLAAATAFMTSNVDNTTRGLLLSRFGSPVSLESPALFAPPIVRTPTVASRVGSTVAIDPLGRGTWVIDEERDSVVLVRASGQLSPVAVGAWPEQLVVDPSGRVFVSCRSAGRVDVIDSELKVRPMAVGAEPRGLALDDTARTLYVGLVTASELVAIDARSGVVLGRHALQAAPYFVAVSGGEVAALPRAGSALYLASADLRRVREVELTTGSRRAWHGQALVPAGDDLLVVNASVDTGLEEKAIDDRFSEFRGGDGYGGSVAAPVELHVAQLHRGELIVAPPVVVQRLGVSEITGAALSGEHLALVSRGTGSIISVPLAKLSHGEVSSNVRNLGEGLTGLALSPTGELVTFAAFDRKLLSVGPGETTPRDPVSLGATTLDAELARGRQLFHRTDDPKTSGDGLACVTCHPDGREDGLVWNLKGARLQTPILAEKLARTAPYNWHGTAATLEESLTQTIQRLGGIGVGPPDLKALARYLREGLRAPVKPQAPDATLVKLGAEVFQRSNVGCAECHTTDGSLTDGARHDVGTLTGEQKTRLTSAQNPVKDPAAFDTPSLLSVGLTAPYFHDGSAPTLDALVADNRDRMGHTSGLSELERKALVAYLKTL